MTSRTSTPEADFLPERAVTMKDVAKQANVAQSTVSRVLSGQPSKVLIAPATRERIRATATRMGYRPNPLARGLRGSRTGLIGLIVREIADPFFGMVLNALMAEGRRRGHSLVLGHAHSSAEEALALTTVLETRHCDAIVVLGDVRDGDALVEELEACGLPVVGVCGGPRLARLPTVNLDNRHGVALALEYLLGLGHRNIGFIDGGWSGDLAERRIAYQEFLGSRALMGSERIVHADDNDAFSGVAAIERLCALDSPPTAVLASTDVIAIGALRGAFVLGYHVPHDMSIIGFDDVPQASVTVPSLTTIRQPVERMAEATLDLVSELIQSPDAGGRREIRLQGSLVIRESCSTPLPARG